MYRAALEDLKKWSTDPFRKPLLLRGARQVGKSTLVKLFAKENNFKLFEVNLERVATLRDDFSSFDSKKILDGIATHIGESFDERSLIFVDEIQAHTPAITSLRYLYEDMPQIPVIAAGSLIEFALTEESVSIPVGRITTMHLYPLSFEEFLLALDEKFAHEKWSNYRLGDSWSETLHGELLRLFKLFTLVGGMPESVVHFAAKKSLADVRKIQEELLANFRDDFAKYARKIELAKLSEIFQKTALSIGRKIKWSEILAGEKTEKTRHLFALLEKAGLYSRVFHADCDGVPLGAQLNLKIAKPYGVDIGLLLALMRFPMTPSLQKDQLNALVEGTLAEQICFQEMRQNFGASFDTSIAYWLREGKRGNAEVDFVVQVEDQLIPVEVKSGKAGVLKSLHQFVATKNSRRAVRFWSEGPAVEKVQSEAMVDEKKRKISFELINLPLYFSGKIKTLLDTLPPDR